MHDRLRSFLATLKRSVTGRSVPTEPSRGRGDQEKKIMVVALHKSGTHLIENILTQVKWSPRRVPEGFTPDLFDTLRPREYLLSHFTPHQSVYDMIERGEVSAVFHYRDPRDVCVSRFNWQHPDNAKVTNTTREFMKNVHRRFRSDDEFLEFIIRGERHISSEIVIGDQFRLSRGLLFHPKVFKTRFEDLIGPRGGGSKDVQVATIAGLFDFLGIKCDPEQVAGNAFSSKSETFNKGRTGSHKEVFSEEITRLFNELHGDVLRDYGYEDDPRE